MAKKTKSAVKFETILEGSIRAVEPVIRGLALGIRMETGFCSETGEDLLAAACQVLQCAAEHAKKPSKATEKALLGAAKLLGRGEERCLEELDQSEAIFGPNIS